MIDPLFDLSGKIIVITGGTGQLGRQFAHTVLNRNAKTVVLDLFENDPLGEYITPGKRDSYLYIKADITDKKTLAASLHKIEETWGVPYGLINCAAIDSPPNARPEDNGPFEEYSLSTWEKIVSVNLTGIF
jgi:NAD(P)-dependent dehydrogenase (short-subunit alcohol dehydrogenase family)